MGPLGGSIAPNLPYVLSVHPARTLSRGAWLVRLMGSAGNAFVGLTTIIGAVLGYFSIGGVVGAGAGAIVGVFVGAAIVNTAEKALG